MMPVENKPELGPASLLVESGQSFVEGWTLQAVRDYADQCAAYAAHGELYNWKRALGRVMQPDFKDWHENSDVELPDVAASVINNLRISLNQSECAADMHIALLRSALATVTELLADRLGTNASEWPAVRAARELLNT